MLAKPLSAILTRWAFTTRGSSLGLRFDSIDHGRGRRQPLTQEFDTGQISVHERLAGPRRIWLASLHTSSARRRPRCVGLLAGCFAAVTPQKLSGILRYVSDDVTQRLR
jgi:hypothetical protein